MSDYSYGFFYLAPKVNVTKITFAQKFQVNFEFSKFKILEMCKFTYVNNGVSPDFNLNPFQVNRNN